MLMKKEVIEDNENLKKEIKDLKKQLEEEKNAYNRMYNRYAEVKERNEKAIEYIKSNDNYFLSDSYMKLLEILKGEDKE